MIESLGLADANYYREWINNKVLLYSTGNYIQYPVINHDEKEKNKNKMQTNKQRKIGLKQLLHREILGELPPVCESPWCESPSMGVTTCVPP